MFLHYRRPTLDTCLLRKLKLANRWTMLAMLFLVRTSMGFQFLDNQKHYLVGQEEIEKLLRQGEGWSDDQLAGNHPLAPSTTPISPWEGNQVLI